MSGAFRNSSFAVALEGRRRLFWDLDHDRLRLMEHTILIARLAAAKRRAKLGQDQIDRQRMVVATLFASGSETTEAENRLRVYEKLHDTYLADMERILDALNAVPPADLAPSHRHAYRPNAPSLTIRSRHA